MGWGWRCGGWVEAVEDEEIALGIVHDVELGDALEVELGGEGLHLVVLDVVPGDEPAGAVGGDAVGELHGAEVVADGGQAGHEGEVGAGDGEDERVVVGVAAMVGVDDALDLVGGVDEGVLGCADVGEGLAGV